MSLVRRTLMALAAPLIAVVAAMVITSLVVFASQSSPAEFWTIIFDPPAPRVYVNIVNQSAMIFLSALAAAVGFQMNLFNIGVEGQYQMASYAAAVFAGAAIFTGALNIVASLVVAMVVGSLWAAIAGVLKVTRGVSEVISTIMLNAVSTGLVAYLLRKLAVREEGSNDIGTREIPSDSWIGGFPLPGASNEVYGFVIIAAVVGIAYSVVINRTRFGFDLRATGQSETAAVASGVDVKRMIVISMLLSGAVAGLVGLPILFGDAYTYGVTFQSGLGFAGIAIALLGRNNAIGIVLGALLFAFLEEQANPLQIVVGVSPQIVDITQGVIVLAVVIVYEVVARFGSRLEQRQAGRDLGTGGDAAAGRGGPGDKEVART